MARVLCLHGLGGMGATMWPVVAALSADHHEVLAPTLPGHGGDPTELIDSGWDDWLAAARAWPADVVVGQSMGAALALALAAEGACQAVVAINPLHADAEAIEGIVWRLSRGHDWLEVGPSALGEVAYERLPLTAVLDMHRGVATIDLGAVSVPVLVVTGQLDDVVDPASSDLVADAVGGPVTRLRLASSGHVATLDADRAELVIAVTQFVARHMRTLQR